MQRFHHADHRERRRARPPARRPRRRPRAAVGPGRRRGCAGGGGRRAKLVGRSPFKKRFFVKPRYPTIRRAGLDQIAVGRKTYRRDVYIPVSGKVHKRDKELAKKLHGSAHTIGPKELKDICRGGPEILFVGGGKSTNVELTEDARIFLAQRSIQCEILPTVKAIESYNKSKRRKAALIHVKC